MKPEPTPVSPVTEAIAALAMATTLAALDPRKQFGLVEALQLWWWCVAIVWSGALAVRILRLREARAALVLEVLLGVAITSLVVLSAVSAPWLSAWSAMTIWSVGMTLATALRLRREGFGANHLRQLAVFVLGCAGSYAWALPTSRAVAALTGTGRFPAWTDYFIHAGEIARLGPFAAFGRGIASLVDVAPDLYHFGSYVLPAAFASLTGAMPLDAAVSTWVGLSFIMLTAGIAAVAFSLRGAVLAIVSLAVLLALPDASRFGIGNGFFGFHWMLVTAPGSGYGIGLVAAAVVLLLCWVKQPRFALLAASALIGGMLILFRVHMALLFAPVGLAFWAAGSALRRRVRPAAMAAGAVVIAAALIGLVALLHAYTQYRFSLLAYLSAIMEQDVGLPLNDAYTLLLSSSSVLAAIFGLAVILVGSLGLPLLVYSVFIVLRIVRRSATLADFVPGMFVASLVLVSVLAPAPWNGDFTEFKQRGFVLVYAILVPWAVLAVGELPWLRVARNRAAATLVSGLAAITCVAAPLAFGNALSAPRFSWSSGLYNVALDPTLTALAEYMAEHRGPADVLVFDAPDPAATLVDEATIVTAMTGVPAFVSRAGIYAARSGRLGDIVRARLKVLASVRMAGDLVDAMRQLSDAAITWYLVPAERAPRWDSEGREATTRIGPWLVYRLG
ncbi:MAG: hypothetical protein HY834_04930 [Devosia nanyangense]|uniref:Uncharacterized protein n=1 Tax=Devosia nanyangense TaxID=1228055 RepID=A0A933L219_9HYPH|nr:hypothetical protein [Devosia nanyangense]